MFLLTNLMFVHISCYLKFSRISLIFREEIVGSQHVKIPPYFLGTLGVLNLVFPANLSSVFVFGLLDSVSVTKSTVLSSIILITLSALSSLSLSIFVY